VASKKGDRDGGKSHTNIIILDGDRDDRKHRRFRDHDSFFGGRDFDSGASVASKKNDHTPSKKDHTNIVILDRDRKPERFRGERWDRSWANDGVLGEGRFGRDNGLFEGGF
jgi:hypothetical protein